MGTNVRKRRTAARPDRTPTAPPPDATALRVNEAAAVLGCSTDHVFKLLKAGHLPRLELGRAVRIARPALDEFIASGGTRAR